MNRAQGQGSRSIAGRFRVRFHTTQICPTLMQNLVQDLSVNRANPA
jgi:hypothetical protein